MPKEPDEVPTEPQPPSENTAPEPSGATTEPTAPASGRRPSIRDIRRQLNEEELKQTGVQKLLIEDFERAEAECEALRGYVQMYHEKDKEVARLTEKLKADVAMEVIAGAGLIGGGAIISLATLFYDPKDQTRFGSLIVVGFFFLVASTLAKIVRNWK